jgi:hypothetical protein
MSKIATERKVIRGSLSADDRAHYAGKWVLVRSGTVVAEADGARALARNPARRRFDAIRRIPRTREVFL